MFPRPSSSAGRLTRRNARNERNKPMRVMVIVKATRNSEAGVMPSENLLAARGSPCRIKVAEWQDALRASEWFLDR